MVPTVRETVNAQVSGERTKDQGGDETLGERVKEEGGKCWGCANLQGRVCGAGTYVQLNGLSLS